MNDRPRKTRTFQHVSSVCPHDCTSVCALDVELLAPNVLGRVRGSARSSYTDGVICEKVARYSQRIHHPERLTQPLRRVGGKGMGNFVPISWSDALDIVAENLVKKSQEYGSETVWPYYYAGTMGHVQRDGINRLRHSKKYSGWLSTICVALSDAGWIAGTGVKRGVSIEEAAEHSDFIVIWGGNPVSTQVNVMMHSMRAKKRGATLVVVDPYRTGTAEKADLHIAPKPGTDGALAVGVMHVLFAEGFADWDYMLRYTDAPEELAKHLKTRSPDWAAAITGVPADTITQFARCYGAAKAPFIRCHHGFSRSRNGAVNMHAVTCLPAVRGAWKVKGGGALYGHSGIYALDLSLIEGTSMIDPSIRLLDQSRLGPILLGDTDALRGGPPVTAMLIQSTNPAIVCPESNKVRQGLSRDDLFVCVHEQFMTDTAKFADIVLPATMFLEHDDFYTASGHTSLQVARKVMEPLGECRENHFVICELAKRLGAEHEGFNMSSLELVDETLRRSGLWDARTNVEQGGQNLEPSFQEAHFLEGFAWPDKKFRFRPDWPSMGARGIHMPRLPDHFDVIDKPTPEKPFRLVTAPARSFLNTSFTETSDSIAREHRPTAFLNFQDCMDNEWKNGDRVILGNERGELTAFVEVKAGQQPGVVVIEGLWPAHYFESEVSVNALTSSDPGFPNGGAVFHDTAIWVRKLRQGS
jgi:anaerobic selenocysteine-containing dehydrogenase